MARPRSSAPSSRSSRRACARSSPSTASSNWQLELQLKGTGKTVHARGARLPQATGGGAVVVFDDITQLIQAQRATAWAEVARRLAHEIKNPLTPIQLSAERLAMKLGERLPPEDAETLRRSTETIVNQVAALKAMVDDFRDYARLPAPEPAPLDLNRLVRQVLALYENSSVPIAKRPRRAAAAGVGRRRADPPGDPQSGAERAGRAREPRRRAARARRSRCAPSWRATASGSRCPTTAAAFPRN